MAQFGLGAFFVLAYFAGRRESEYFVFGLLCFSLSVMSIGVSLDYHDGAHPHGILADQIGLSGAIFAAALNVHFALCFSTVTAALAPRAGRCICWRYFSSSATGRARSGCRAQFQIVLSDVFGVRVEHMVGATSRIGNAFYVVGLLETSGHGGHFGARLSRGQARRAGLADRRLAGRAGGLQRRGASLRRIQKYHQPLAARVPDLRLRRGRHGADALPAGGRRARADQPAFAGYAPTSCALRTPSCASCRASS